VSSSSSSDTSFIGESSASASGAAELSVPFLSSFGLAFAKDLKMLEVSFFRAGGAGVPSLLVGALPAAGVAFDFSFDLAKKSLAAVDCCVGLASGLAGLEASAGLGLGG